jgi:DNA-binding NtrC family response regulator
MLLFRCFYAARTGRRTAKIICGSRKIRASFDVQLRKNHRTVREPFGHRRGAFSGAVGDRKELFQAADHGTILLDDVNDLPAPLQPKLLDVIQRGTVRPVGSDREVCIDVRIIAACNRPLEPLVQEGRFRPDLYHRLNVVKLWLPPLRERAEDLAGLLLVLAERHRRLFQRIHAIEPELVALIRSKAFVGNVRELENAVQRMLFHKTEGTSLGVEDWIAQSGPENAAPDPDLLADAAGAVWQTIAEGACHSRRRFMKSRGACWKWPRSVESRAGWSRNACTPASGLFSYKMRAPG